MRVIIEAGPDEARAWQGLRAAAGYLAVELAVEIALDVNRDALLAAAERDTDDAVGRAGRRALRAFAAMGRVITDGARPPVDVELRW